MRTLSTQVRLRRLLRSFDEAVNRLLSDPHERSAAGSVAARLLELAAAVREAWRHENVAGRLPKSLERYVRDAMRTMDLAIAGVQQAGADLELLRQDFEEAALPLEIFMRGLDAEPALQRSASGAILTLAEPEPTQWAYAGGFVDGEGCIAVTRSFVTRSNRFSYGVCVVVCNRDRSVFVWMKTLWGGRVVSLADQPRARTHWNLPRPTR